MEACFARIQLDGHNLDVSSFGGHGSRDYQTKLGICLRELDSNGICGQMSLYCLNLDSRHLVYNVIALLPRMRHLHALIFSFLLFLASSPPTARMASSYHSMEMANIVFLKLVLQFGKCFEKHSIVVVRCGFDLAWSQVDGRLGKEQVGKVLYGLHVNVGDVVVHERLSGDIIHFHYQLGVHRGQVEIGVAGVDDNFEISLGSDIANGWRCFPLSSLD